MSTETSFANDPKSLRYIIIALFLALVFAFFKLYLQEDDGGSRTDKNPGLEFVDDGAKVPFSNETKQFMLEQGFPMAVFLSADGKLKLVSPEGSEIPTCPVKNFTERDGECKALKKAQNLMKRDLTVINFRHNPNCQSVRSGRVLSVPVHSDGPFAGMKRCHAGGPGVHRF